MKILVLFAITLVLVSKISGQAMVLHDPVTSRTFNTSRYSEIKGTPFFNEDWLPGTATSPRGIFKNLKLKLDAYSNTVYCNKDDEAYEFEDEITGFTLVKAGDTLVFRKGLTGSNLKPVQYVQVLSEGKVSLYRSDVKMISEMSEINAGMVKTFMNSTRYYIVKDGKTELVKLNKSDIMKFLEDKEDQVKEYIDKNKIGTRKENDFAKILNYYNSI